MREAGLSVELAGVDKSYWLAGRPIEVLRGVDLRIDAGEIVAIVGSSGSGKSTLLHMLGLLDQPSAGRILHGGRELRREPEDVIEDFRNQHVGFVFQFHHLLPEFTATENVMMPALIAGETMGEARDRAEALLERVGLQHRRTHAPGELSGGEQQRVAIARAVSLRPRLLLADEPTGNLDPTTSSAIHELLIAMNEEMGTTLLVATHNMDLARLLPRCLSIRGGAITPFDPHQHALASESR